MRHVAGCVIDSGVLPAMLKVTPSVMAKSLSRAILRNWVPTLKLCDPVTYDTDPYAWYEFQSCVPRAFAWVRAVPGEP